MRQSHINGILSDNRNLDLSKNTLTTHYKNSKKASRKKNSEKSRKIFKIENIKKLNKANIKKKIDHKPNIQKDIKQ